MKRVGIVGTGLVGASIGLALTRDGVTVRGFDTDPARAAQAVERGAATEAVPTLSDAATDVDVVIVAVPVGDIAGLVIAALDAGAPAVTDVGSVKAPIVAAVEAARPDFAGRFVGGHPMAGSEQGGLDGADGDLFVGGTWVLTPTDRTDASVFSTVRRLVAGLGAEVIAVTPSHHDDLVAVVSHVPQLAATTLMDVAAGGGEEHATLLTPGGGWVPRHDADRGRPPGHLARHLRSEPGRHRRCARRVRRRVRVVRALVAGPHRDGLLELLERARARDGAYPSAGQRASHW